MAADEKFPLALPQGTILAGQYVIDHALGQGGFGITYKATDHKTGQKVAVKEFFPETMATRTQTTVTAFTGERGESFAYGKSCFLQEAETLAEFIGNKNIVKVHSYFEENGTAYFVMDFVEGETLLKKLQREGPMDFDTCVALLTPIMKALAEVHTHGIIHRDISPDNIMVQKDGRLILLDLGAAKDLEISDADGAVQSSQLVAKQGFSPIEQYGRNGKIGPWTDVYAMAATIYHCCTGILPPSAVDRIVEDTLSCQPLLNQRQYDALASCMVILPEKRLQDMGALLKALAYVPPKQEPPKSKPPKPKQPKSKSESPKGTMIIKAILVGLAAAIPFIAIYLVTETGLFRTVDEEKHITSQVSNPPISSQPTETVATLSPQEVAYENAEALLAEGNNAEAAMAFGKLGNYSDARERSFSLWEKITQRETVSAGGNSNVCLKSDGTVSRVVNNYSRNMGAQDISDWRDIVAVSAGDDHTVGLKSDGTVVAAAVVNNWGQSDVSSWSDIVSISAGYTHTVGLRSDGTVVAVGESNHNGQCDVSDWTGIVAVSAGTRYTVGLKYDGTVVATSFTDEREKKYYCGQCDVSDWRDIVAISAGKEHTVGLKSDGTVVAVGSNEDGQCNVADWTDIVAISTGDAYTVGLRKDGTVVAVGDNYYDQCRVASRWDNIVAISAGNKHVVGLKSDGTVVAAGIKFTGLCDVSDWMDILIPSKRRW